MQLAYLRTGKELSKLQCEVVTDLPNGNLYHLDGKLIVNSAAPDFMTGEDTERPLSLSMGEGQVLLRGMTVRNTSKVWGVVIYTGM